MPKVFGKEVSTTYLACAVALTGTLVWFVATSPSDSAKSKTTRKRTTTTKKGPEDMFTEEDRKAKFTVLNEPVKNIFRPLVGKPVPTLVGNPVGMGANFLPAGLTGGDGNWAYTGYAEVDGTRQGLLENGSTGESVFLQNGQRWKLLVVRTIEAEKMTVSGPDGAAHTIPIGDAPAEQKLAAGVPPIGGVAPLNPSAALRGTIGGAVPGVPGAAAVVPGGDPTLSLQPDPNSGDPSQFNRRGRRRRGN